MGITIHFEGKLKNLADLEPVLQHARELAENHNWRFIEIPKEVRSLDRVCNEEDWNYVGMTSGVEIYPHKDSEALRLEFDADGYIQEYVKTQFAPIETHMAVIELLRQLQSSFVNLEVVDESDFWETNDTILLENHFKRFFEVVNDEKKKNPRLGGPYRLENGRIVDLWED